MFVNGEIINKVAHKGNDDFIMYKGKTIGMDLKQNVLKVGHGSAVCLETILNAVSYYCSDGRSEKSFKREF